MNVNDIFYLETDIELIEKQFDKFLEDNHLECMDFVIDNKGFALIGQVASKVILYEKKVYYISQGATYSVHLHAIRSYKDYEDAMNNIDGDLSYYLYGYPTEEERYDDSVR